MRMMIIVLNQVEKLDELLCKLGDNGISGATILSSQGMAQELKEHHVDTNHFMFSFGKILGTEEEHEESKTILVALNNEQLLLAKAAISAVIDINQPNTAAVFIMPLEEVWGIDIGREQQWKSY